MSLSINPLIKPSPTMRRRVGLYEKALPADQPWEARLLAAKELGFDFVEISIDESDVRRARLDWSDQEIQALRHLCEQHAMPLHSMCLSAHRKFPFGSADPAVRQHAVDIMEKALTLAYQLGIRVIQLAGYDVYYEPSNDETHRRFIEGMQLCSQLAERFGVMLAVEIMDTNYLNSLSKFELLKRHVPSPYFMAYPDVGNIHGWRYDVCTELKLSQSHIVQIHLKDTHQVSADKAGQFRDLVIGEGSVDFEAIFKTLNQMQCDVPLVIEMWANDAHWKENIIKAKQILKSAAEKAQVKLFEVSK